MESVGGVVALPESRRRGYTARVMAALVADMRERGVPISTITTPFSYAFYRRAGWEYAFRRLRARFAPRLGAGAAAAGEGVAGEARFVDWDPASGAAPAQLDSVYRRVARQRYQGAAARPPDLWCEHLQGERTYAYVWAGPDGPAGYTICALGREGRLRVREILAAEVASLCGLLGLLANFDSQAEVVECDLPPDVRLDLLLPEQNDLELHWRAAGMLRVVDVAAAVAARRAADLTGRLCLRLRDEHAPWNRGPWAIEWCEGRAAVRPWRGSHRPDEEAAMDQRTFAQIYAGALTPAEAVRLGRAEAGPAALAVLTGAYVTGQAPLLLESF